MPTDRPARVRRIAIGQAGFARVGQRILLFKATVEEEIQMVPALDSAKGNDF